MSLTGKYLNIAVIFLVVVLVGLGTYIFGFNLGRNSARVSTDSAKVSTNAATAGNKDDLIRIKVGTDQGTAVGKVKALASNEVSLTNEKGDQTIAFVVSSDTEYYRIPITGTEAVKGGDFSKLKVGMAIQIAFLREPNGSYLALSVFIPE